MKLLAICLSLVLPACASSGPWPRDPQVAAKQHGTGADIPTPAPIPNRPQYQHPGGPVGTPKTPPTSGQIFKNPCISVACRTFCRPDNQSAPLWCSHMLPPKDGYLEPELKPHE